MRPWLSVTGTRCTRCAAALVLERAARRRRPDTTNVTSLKPPRSLASSDSVSTSQAVAAGVGAVHLVEVAGEQVGLLAALGAADLDDDVAPGVRIGRHHQLAQLVVDRRRAPRWSPPARPRAARARRRSPRRAARAPPRRRRRSARWRRAASTTGVELVVAAADACAARPGRRRPPGRRGAPRGRRAPARWRRGGLAMASDDSDTARPRLHGPPRRSCRFLSCNRLKFSVSSICYATHSPSRRNQMLRHAPVPSGRLPSIVRPPLRPHVRPARRARLRHRRRRAPHAGRRRRPGTTAPYVLTVDLPGVPAEARRRRRSPAAPSTLDVATDELVLEAQRIRLGAGPRRRAGDGELRRRPPDRHRRRGRPRPQPRTIEITVGAPAAELETGADQPDDSPTNDTE